MVEQSHAEHRPPPPGQEAGFHNPEQMGVLYPENDFVAVIQDPEQAQQAVQAVRALGISDENIDLVDNARALVIERAAERHRGLGDRMKRLLSHVFSDDADYQDRLTQAVHAGGSLVIVHVTDDATVRAVGEVMLAHDARASRYYRKGSVEDLV